MMALFGAHVSAAGSVLETFSRAEELSAETFQFFLRSPRVWGWKGVSNKLVEEFRRRRSLFCGPVAVHAPYLLNLASPDGDLRKRSVEVLVQELEFCNRAGVDFYVFHPGSATRADRREALRNVLLSLEEIFRLHEPEKTVLLVENTAGGGDTLGGSLEELGEIVSAFPDSRLGVCLDTCHAFAYRYRIDTETGFARFLKELERKVGLERVKLIHANDSRAPAGSKVDRHEHIGEGYIGPAGFANFLHHEYLSELPYCIETPKTDGMDRVNLRRLRELAQDKRSGCKS